MDQVNDQAVSPKTEQPPQAKRRISRLQHMSISKPSKASQRDELCHKLPSKSIHEADDEDMQDVQDSTATYSPKCSSDQHTATPAASATPEASAVAAAVGSGHSRLQDALRQGSQHQQQEHVQQAQCSSAQPPSSSLEAAQAVVDEHPAFTSPMKARGSTPAASAQPEPQPQQQPWTQQGLPPSAVVEETEHTPAVDTAAGSSAEAAAAHIAAAAAADGSASPAPPAAAAGAVAAAAGPVAMQLEDEDDDDDWEDQPAPLLPDDLAGDDAEAAASASDEGGDDSMAGLTGPGTRRCEQFDDEDEWEDLVIEQKHTQQQGPQQHGSAPGSQASGAESGGAGGNILMEDEDAADAATQRLLRESATRTGFGKGFKPQVAPLSSLLSKLQARQAALEARAAQAPAPAAAAAEQPKPVLSLEEVRAHLERHSVMHKQHHKQQHGGSSATAGSGPDPAGAAAAAAGQGVQQHAGSGEAAAGNGDAMDQVAGPDEVALAGDIDDIDDLDNFIVEAAQQQLLGFTAAAAQLPPETQEVMPEDGPSLEQLAEGMGPAVGTEMTAELDLQLGDEEDKDADREGAAADRHKQQQGLHGGASGAAGRLVDAEAAESKGDEAAAEKEGTDFSGGDGEEAEASGEEEEASEDEGSEGEEDSDPLADLSLSEEEEEGPSLQQQEPEIEPEPLNWEEEEGLGEDSQEQRQQQRRQVESGSGRVNAARLVAKLRHKAAAYGFIEAEAELSDDEQGLSEDEDDEDQDGMLEELLAEATEGRMDESKRAALHSRWADAQEAKQIRELLNAIKNGFKRKRRLGAGLEGDEDEDGTDAEARRRRARLLGLADGEGEGGEEDEAVIAGTDRLQRLDFSWRQEDEVDAEAAAAAVAAEQAARQKRQQLQRLTKQASESQQDGDIMHLMHLEVDADSQHTVDLLTKSASLHSAPSADAAASRDMLRAGNRGPSNLRHATGPGSGAQEAGVGVSAAAVGSSKTAARQQLTGAGGPGAAAAAAGGGGFSFKMFGKDLGSGGGSAVMQKSSSFIGRQANTTAGVRSASNYGGSRHFVFGSDPSNYSNPAGGGSNHGPPQPQQQQGGDSKAGGAGSLGAVGPASFAGLGNMIAEAKGGAPGRGGTSKHAGATSAAAGGAGGSSMLLNALHSKAGSKAAAPASNVVTAAIETKLAGAGRRQINGGARLFE